jgi:thymidine kinase
VPFSDKVTKIQSLCSFCKNGKKGIFSHRITTEEAQIVIGNDIYKPLCRKCYLENQPVATVTPVSVNPSVA